MHRDLTRYDITESAVDRLEAKTLVRGIDECWEWQGSRTPTGYGKLSIGRRTQYAHRFAFMLAYDADIPVGMHVMHSCDNPSCCNPDHLRLGTALDNMRDRDRKGRGGIKKSRIDGRSLEVMSLYESGLTPVEIGGIIGMSGISVWHWLKKNSVKMRARGELRRERNKAA